MNHIIKSLKYAFLLILLQLAYSSLKFLLIFNGTKVFSSLNFTEVFSSHFSIEAIQFFIVVLIIHALFASTIIKLTKMLRAIDSIRPAILNFSYFSIFYFYLILIHSYFFPNSDFTINTGSQYTLFITLIASTFIIYSFKTKQLAGTLNTIVKNSYSKIKACPKTIVSLSILLCFLLTLQLTKSAFITNPTLVNTQTSNSPNIIILSVDSLRADITNPAQPNSSPAPFISEQLGLSHNFTQAYTPLARTFPAWMSLLTGKQPKNHKAEFNLTNPERFKNEVTLAQILQKNNYHTVFASDEKRFANITNDLGFTEVLGPPYGLSDFLLGAFSDLPLLNFVTLIPHAELILPYSTNNRATHKNYEPDSFTRYLNNKLENSVTTANGKPLFIAVHLCLPHHPFSWRLSHLTNSAEENYTNTVIRADQQIESIYKSLKLLNIINEDSIQIFMSDHGEALPKDEKTFIKPNGTAKIITGLGHGTNSLQIKQHHIVLGIQHPTLSTQNDSQMVSLIDIAPTLLELVPSLNHPSLDFDGYNVLKTNLKNPKKRWLSFETGYNVDAVKHAQLNEAEIFKQAAHAYKITPEGKVVIKNNIYDKLVSQKQYTWWDGKFLITHSNDKWDKYNWHDSTFIDIDKPLRLKFQEGLNH